MSSQWLEGAEALVALLFEQLGKPSQPRAIYIAAGRALSTAMRLLARASHTSSPARGTVEGWFERSLRLPLTPVHRAIIAALAREALDASTELAAFAVEALRRRAEAQVTTAQVRGQQQQSAASEALAAAVALASLLFGIVRQVQSRPFLAQVKGAIEGVVFSAADPTKPETLASATELTVALMRSLRDVLCARTPAYERPSLARWYLQLAGRIEGVLDEMSWAAQKGDGELAPALIRSRL